MSKAQFISEYSGCDDLCPRAFEIASKISASNTAEITDKYAKLIVNGVLNCSVDISGMLLVEIPAIFNGITVTGDFYCGYNQLTTLQGAPREVGGVFTCGYNQLTTLQGAPQEVGGNFDCDHNQLTTLQGAPQEVGGNFDCEHNQLTTLQGAPQEVDGSFYCRYNKLTTLQGAPQKIRGRLYHDTINEATNLVDRFLVG